MDRSLLKQIILEQKRDLQAKTNGVKRHRLSEIEPLISLPHIVIIMGIRRVGKSTLLRQILKKLYRDDLYYLDFEDERLIDFTAKDFNTLYETFIELYGLKTVFFLDEIQNVPDWELFVRRLHREKNKLFLTGSNAILLSSELSTKLTGRHVVIELLPFSFKEYLKISGISIHKDSLMITQDRALLKRSFNTYLEEGGMPEYLENKNPIVLQTVYENILFKDVIARYQIKAVKALRELSLFLLTNVGSPISYSNLQKMLALGSINTLKNYIHYLENAYLIFTLSQFSFSVGTQTIAHKKVYAVDTGFIKYVAFQFSKNSGKYLENVVYLELRRRYKEELYYYRTKNNLEVDFLIRQGTKIISLIQVTESLSDPKTREREIKALTQAMQELKVEKGLILTLDEKETLCSIEVIPIYEWLLQ
jgi:predicted AAA+ superfamily ATPase